MTKAEMFSAKYGDKVKANGFTGFFGQVYDKSGIVEVKLPGGWAALAIEEVELMKEEIAKA